MRGLQSKAVFFLSSFPFPDFSACLFMYPRSVGELYSVAQFAGIVPKKDVLCSSQLARRINPWSHLGLRTISIMECQQREKHVEGGSSLFIKMPFKLTFYTLIRWIMRWGNRREFRWFIKTFALKSIYLVCHYYTRVDYSFPTNPVVIFHFVILF